jgi:hypothetical protein
MNFENIKKSKKPIVCVIGNFWENDKYDVMALYKKIYRRFNDDLNLSFNEYLITVDRYLTYASSYVNEIYDTVSSRFWDDYDDEIRELEQREYNVMKAIILFSDVCVFYEYNAKRNFHAGKLLKYAYALKREVVVIPIKIEDNPYDDEDVEIPIFPIIKKSLENCKTNSSVRAFTDNYDEYNKTD